MTHTVHTGVRAAESKAARTKEIAQLGDRIIRAAMENGVGQVDAQLIAQESLDADLHSLPRSVRAAMVLGWVDYSCALAIDFRT